MTTIFAYPGAKLFAVASLVWTLAGCATFSSGNGFDSVQSIAQDRTQKDLRWIRSDADAQSVRQMVEQRLSQPLTVHDAVQIAVLNNRRLQANYSELNLSQADLVQASWIRNPGFSF